MIRPGRPAIVVTITDGLEVHIDDQRDPVHRRVLAMPSIVAVQLGAAIQSAAVWAGQEKARREARKR